MANSQNTATQKQACCNINYSNISGSQERNRQLRTAKNISITGD